MKTPPRTAQQLVDAARRGIEEISADEMQRRLAMGAVLIDVREPAEFADGHIAGAANIPRGVLEFQVQAHPAMNCTTAPELALHDRPVTVYCRMAGRAALAAESVVRMGFSAVASLAGGILGWQQEGRSLTTGA